MALVNGWLKRFENTIKARGKPCSACRAKNFSINTSPVPLLNVPDGTVVQQRGSLSGVLTCLDCASQTLYSLDVLGLIEKT